jgi:hypothetical protein
MFFGNIGSSGSTKVPVTTKERDRQAIAAIQTAMSKPKTPGFKLIECEFPPLAALNKLGDGSLQSANQVDAANISFAAQLSRSLSIPLVGPTATLLLGTAATQGLRQKAQKAYPVVESLQKGSLPNNIDKSSIYVFVAPSSTKDYSLAETIARDYGATVILVNGFAKTQKSVSAQATMAYYLRPLTYNSQVSGYLLRVYPQPWTTWSAKTGTPTKRGSTPSSSTLAVVLQTATDRDILVPQTNTPDLRASVKAVQQYVDQQAMAARQMAS